MFIPPKGAVQVERLGEQKRMPTKQPYYWAIPIVGRPPKDMNCECKIGYLLINSQLYHENYAVLDSAGGRNWALCDCTARIIE